MAGRPQKYPWDEWLDGERHVLREDRDFPDVYVDSMRMQIYTEARKRGVPVSMKVARNPYGNGIDYIEIKKAEPTAPTGKQRDWGKLFDSLPVILQQGKHFECSIATMRQMVYQAAGRRGIKVSTMQVGKLGIRVDEVKR